MAHSGEYGRRILEIAKIFWSETDEDHGITMADIISRLAEQGVSAERKSVYRAIEVLEEFGMDIETVRNPYPEYALVSRPFEFPELLLLVDAVQSSRFLTERKSSTLVNHIKRLTSRYQAQLLSTRIHVERRIKMQNESIYYNVDAIQRALRERHKITFCYFEFDTHKQKQLRHDGRRYSETPVSLVYADEYYYLISYNDKHQSFVRYRVDRMLSIEVSDEPATHNQKIASFDVQSFGVQSFGMFDGSPVKVEITADRSVVGSIVDRFGSDVKLTAIDDQRVRIIVPVLESPVFFGWVAQFGTLMHIEKPQSVARAYRAYLAGIIASYKSIDPDQDVSTLPIAVEECRATTPSGDSPNVLTAADTIDTSQNHRSL
ncbi:MAG: WYL domain-containing protein [Eggerthellaceae bacterium]|jgi:predicted DNA-binding transcriptional regulator YafY|nr:WYL domain-containing protein [Eggerthellaceae bacterium]MCH4221395.1 WYL domain-containing protein [Eggerthellaceae bacterium]